MGLTTYAFNTSTIRVVTIEGEPWFVAADVCQALGVYIRADGFANPSQVCKKLRPDEVQLFTVNRIGSGCGTPRVVLVSESGLYKLVLRSDKPEAKKFQDWVTRYVLPTIRKDGVYGNGAEKGATSKDVAAHFDKRHDVVMHA